MAMPEKTTILEKVPSDVTPEDLAKISDEDIVALHDSIHAMLLKGQIEEDEFTLLRDIIIQEMRNRGIKPLAEYKAEFHSQGPLVNSAYRDLGSFFVKVMDGAVTVSPVKSTDGANAIRINFDVDGIQKNLDEAMLAIAGRYKNSELLAFSSKKDAKGLPLFDLFLVPFGRAVMSRVPKPNGSPDEIEYYSSLPDATGQFMSAARSSSKKNSLEPSRFFKAMRQVRGVHPEVSQTNEALMEIFSDRQFPLYAVVRYSDVDVQIHRSSGQVSIFTQTGKNVTSLLPQVVEKMKQIGENRDLILLATLKFTNSDGTSAGTSFSENDLRQISLKGKDISVSIMPYDLLYYGEDIHPMEWTRRMTPEERQQLDPNSVKPINSLKHFNSVINGVFNKRDATGCLIYGNSPYNLSFYANDLIKVDKAFRFNAFIVSVEKTTLPGVNNMRLAVETGSLNFSPTFHVFMNEMNLIDIGHSHASSRWACQGDVVEVEATTLRHHFDTRSGLSSFEVVSPRIVNRASGIGFPFSANSLIEKAAEVGAYTFGLVKPDAVRYASTLSKDNPVLNFLWETKPNEIRYRVRDPKGFTEGKWGSIWIKKDKPRVRAIVGVPKGETSSVIQALRFPLEDGWTVAQAKSWAASHNFSELYSRPVEDDAEPIGADEVAGLFK